MSDIELFRIDSIGVTQLDGRSIALEKSLQARIERNSGCPVKALVRSQLRSQLRMWR